MAAGTFQNNLLRKKDELLDDEIIIPDKLYFKISEVCEIIGVKQHVLRYWESEFKIINPRRTKSGQRLYRRLDLDNILKIKTLLKEECFTIAGVQQRLAREKSRKHSLLPAKQAQTSGVFFKKLKAELREIKEILEK